MLNSSNLVHELREEVSKLKKFEEEIKVARDNELRAVQEANQAKADLKEARATIDELLYQSEMRSNNKLISRIFDFVGKTGWYAGRMLREQKTSDIRSWDYDDLATILAILKDLAHASEMIQDEMDRAKYEFNDSDDRVR